MRLFRVKGHETSECARLSFPIPVAGCADFCTFGFSFVSQYAMDNTILSASLLAVLCLLFLIRMNAFGVCLILIQERSQKVRCLLNVVYDFPLEAIIMRLLTTLRVV